MLKIINDLAPFFEDCYRRINVREYAKMMDISPPTASTLLAAYNKDNLLEKEKYRNYIFYYAKKNSKTFIDLSRIYWHYKLGDLIKFIDKSFINSTIMLFGSLSKAETKPDSDIDLVIISKKKELKIERFEKKLKRKIQIFYFNSIEDIKNEGLKKNIINGYLLNGRL